MATVRPSAPRAGPGSRTKTSNARGRRCASARRDTRSGSTPQARAQAAMYSRGGAASSIGIPSAPRRPRRKRRPDRRRRARSGRRPARAMMGAIRRERGAGRPEGGARASPRARNDAPAPPSPGGCVIATSGRTRPSPKLCKSIRSLPDRIASSAAASISRKIRAVTPAVSCEPVRTPAVSRSTPERRGKIDARLFSKLEKGDHSSSARDERRRNARRSGASMKAPDELSRCPRRQAAP